MLAFVDPGVAITASPVPVAACAGDTVMFTVAATGENLSYQWQKGSVNLQSNAVVSGETTPTLTLTGVRTSDAANYKCVVTNACNSLVSSAAALTVRTGPPSFTTHPFDRTRCVGVSATFTVAASGSPAFQWRKDSVTIPDATNTTYTIASPVVADAGTLDCVALNPCGSVTSNPAQFVVNQTPEITTQPVSQMFYSGTPVTWMVAGIGSPSFQWRKDQADIPNATDSSFTITAPTAADLGQYDCVLFNGCGSVTSAPAMLEPLGRPLLGYGPGGLSFSNGHFGFSLLGPTGMDLVIQRSSNLLFWVPIGTNTLPGGSNYFFDPQPTNRTPQFYRTVGQ